MGVRWADIQKFPETRQDVPIDLGDHHFAKQGFFSGAVGENLFRTQRAVDKFHNYVVVPPPMHLRAEIGVLNSQPLAGKTPRQPGASAWNR